MALLYQNCPLTTGVGGCLLDKEDAEAYNTELRHYGYNHKTNRAAPRA